MTSLFAPSFRRATTAALTLLVGSAVVARGQEWRGPVAIEVVVEDNRGKDVPGAEVRLVYLAPSGGGVLPPVTTDAGGKVAIGGLAAGRWMIEVSRSGLMTYRAEIALSADNRPAVLSAAQEMAPGATGTMRVKLNRSKGGAAPPVREVTAPAAPAPRAASTPPAQRPVEVPAAPAPTAAAPAAKPAVPVATAEAPAVPKPAPASPAAPAGIAPAPVPAPAPAAKPATPAPAAAAPQPMPSAPVGPPTTTVPPSVPTPAAKPIPAATPTTPAAPTPQPLPAAPVGPPTTPAPAVKPAVAPAAQPAAPAAKPVPPAVPTAPATTPAPQTLPAAPIGPSTTTAPAVQPAVPPAAQPATPAAPPRPAPPIAKPQAAAPPAPVAEAKPSPMPIVPAPAAPAKPAPAPAPAATPPAAPAAAPVVPAIASSSSAPSTAPVAATPPAATAPSPAPAAPARQRLCVECAPGESAQWGEATIEGGAGAGCPADLRQQLDAVSLAGDAGFAALDAALGPGCRAIRVELPAGARFTGFRYEASGGAVTADCLPGRECPAGGARFPFEPVLRREGGRTILLVAFESTAAEPRAAVVAGYFSFTRK